MCVRKSEANTHSAAKGQSSVELLVKISTDESNWWSYKSFNKTVDFHLLH